MKKANIMNFGMRRRSIIYKKVWILGEERVFEAERYGITGGYDSMCIEDGEYQD